MLVAVVSKSRGVCTCCALKDARDSSSRGRRRTVRMMRHMRPDNVTAALPILSVGVCEGCAATCKLGTQ